MRNALEEETLRLYERYQVEIVEAHNLCPWARAARLSGNMTALVRSCHGGEKSGARAAAAALNEASALDSEIVLLLFPEYTGSRAAFERLTAALIRLDSEQYRLQSPPFAIAAFHPSAEMQPTSTDSAHAERLIPYLRRSPDATLQLVRLSALERVRRGEVDGTQFIDPSQLDLTSFAFAQTKPDTRESLRRRIAITNQKTLISPSGAALRARMRDIMLDRFLTHQRLGLPLCSWEEEFVSQAPL